VCVSDLNFCLASQPSSFAVSTKLMTFLKQQIQCVAVRSVTWPVQVIEPVRSRCLCIRVAAPTYPEVEDMLSHVAQKEGLQLPDPLRQRIAQTSERNLRRALLCFETCHMTQYPFKDNQAVQMTDWELYVQVHFLLEESGLL